MTSSVILPAKSSNETFPVKFPFQDQMEFGESISGQVVTCSVFSGTDPNPSAVILGAATLQGTTVVQVVTGGLPGVIYQLVALANTSNENLYSKDGKLSIVNAPANFNGP